MSQFLGRVLLPRRILTGSVTLGGFFLDAESRETLGFKVDRIHWTEVGALGGDRVLLNELGEVRTSEGRLLVIRFRSTRQLLAAERVRLRVFRDKLADGSLDVIERNQHSQLLRVGGAWLFALYSGFAASGAFAFIAGLFTQWHSSPTYLRIAMIVIAALVGGCAVFMVMLTRTLRTQQMRHAPLMVRYTARGVEATLDDGTFCERDWAPLLKDYSRFRGMPLECDGAIRFVPSLPQLAPMVFAAAFEVWDGVDRRERARRGIAGIRRALYFSIAIGLLAAGAMAWLIANGLAPAQAPSPVVILMMFVGVGLLPFAARWAQRPISRTLRRRRRRRQRKTSLSDERTKSSTDAIS